MQHAPWGNIYAVGEADIDNKVTILENIHLEIIKKHAPLRTFRVTRPATTWLTDEIKALMDNRDRYKNKFNENKREETNILFKEARNKVTHAIRDSKIKMFNEHINTKVKNPKQFHQALRNFNIVESGKQKKHDCLFNPTILNQYF